MQAGVSIDGQTDGHTQKKKQTQKNRQTDGQMDRQIDGRTDRQTDKKKIPGVFLVYLTFIIVFPTCRSTSENHRQYYRTGF